MSNMKKAHLFLICGLAAAVGTVSADALECRAVEEEGVIYLYLDGTSLERAGKGSTNNFYTEIGDTAYNRYIPQDPSITAVFSNKFVNVDIISSEMV